MKKNNKIPGRQGVILSLQTELVKMAIKRLIINVCTRMRSTAVRIGMSQCRLQPQDDQFKAPAHLEGRKINEDSLIRSEIVMQDLKISKVGTTKVSNCKTNEESASDSSRKSRPYIQYTPLQKKQLGRKPTIANYVGTMIVMPILL